jgi:GH43 family beta-xylosidase
MSTAVTTPLIEQRADPFIFKHIDGMYYFTASVPEYDRLEVRRASTIAGLAAAAPVTVWRKPDTGPFSELIWAPEIHFNEGAWYIYFAAAPSREIKDDLFQHRMYAISCPAANPLEGPWSEVVRIDTGIESFCLDATTFYHNWELYYLWAQKGPGIPGNSNLYIARMDTPVTLAAEPVRLSIPERDWECVGFSVNEGPGVLRKGNRLFVTYSASATDENYCVGLLSTTADANLLDPASWTKSPRPVFQSAPENRIFGPGHNSFTVSEDGSQDILVYHARTYTEIVGDPLWDPNRHTFTKPVQWDANGWPVFGKAGE